MLEPPESSFLLPCFSFPADAASDHQDGRFKEKCRQENVMGYTQYTHGLYRKLICKRQIILQLLVCPCSLSVIISIKDYTINHAVWFLRYMISAIITQYWSVPQPFLVSTLPMHRCTSGWAPRSTRRATRAASRPASKSPTSSWTRSAPASRPLPPFTTRKNMWAVIPREP